MTEEGDAAWGGTQNGSFRVEFSLLVFLAAASPLRLSPLFFFPLFFPGGVGQKALSCMPERPLSSYD